MFYPRFARLVKARPCNYIEERNVWGERHREANVLTSFFSVRIKAGPLLHGGTDFLTSLRLARQSGTVITSRSECSNLASLGSSKRDGENIGGLKNCLNFKTDPRKCFSPLKNLYFHIHVLLEHSKF